MCKHAYVHIALLQHYVINMWMTLVQMSQISQRNQRSEEYEGFLDNGRMVSVKNTECYSLDCVLIFLESFFLLMAEPKGGSGSTDRYNSCHSFFGSSIYWRILNLNRLYIAA